MSDRPSSSRRQPRADATRNRRRILDAATSVFAEKGPAATLSDVARTAGVGIGTIYRNFDDKESLLDALFDDKIDTVIRVAVEAAEVQDPGVAFRTYLWGMIEAHSLDRSLATVLFTSNRVDRFPAHLSDQLASTADGLIAAAIEAGELRAGFTRQDTTVLAIMVRTIVAATGETAPGLRRRYADIVVDGTRPTSHAGPLRPAPLDFTSTAEALGRTL